jgi:hypothetical protein
MAINGSEGCTAWAKSSPDSGSEQMFSNIAAAQWGVCSARVHRWWIWRKQKVIVGD